MNQTNNTIGNGRYRGLIVSIALLIALIISLLLFTFYTSNLIQRNTVLLNETNRIAVAAQEVIKDLFDLDNSYGEDINSPHIQRTLERLEESSAYITDSLTAVQSGGAVRDSDGQVHELPKINSESILADIRQAQEQWALLEPRVAAYLADADNITVDSSDELAQAVEQAKTSSLLIIEALNDLNEDVFEESATQAEQIRSIQILGVLGLFLYFIFFVFFFVRRLRKSDAETIEARRETQEIMQTVSTGLFLLDQDLTIGQQHSKALADIVGTNKLAGEDFTSILRGRISDKDLTTTKQFIEQLYNPRVKEKLVEGLNPLRRVMLHSENSGQEVKSRYLDFRFSRVYEGKKIARILVNVIDVSDAVQLEQRLEQERSQNDMQIEMLTTILNVDPHIIREFIQNTKEHIAKVNDVLKNPGSSQGELENKLALIYREIHSLKGEASALKLHSFTKIATEAENKLHAMQNQGRLSGNDFLPLAVDLDELLSLSNTIETLGERINQAAYDNNIQAIANTTNPINHIDDTTSASSESPSTSVMLAAQSHDAPVNDDNADSSYKDTQGSVDSDIATDDMAIDDIAMEIATDNEPATTAIDIAATELTDISLTDDPMSMLAEMEYIEDEPKKTSINQGLIDFYHQFANDIAERQGKEVVLDTTSYEDVQIPESLKSVTKEITIQLLRNAIVHGIEKPQIRRVANKDEAGHVVLDITRQDAGEQETLVLTLKDDGAGINYDAIRQKLKSMGKFADSKIDALTQGQLLNVLFSSGFSTNSSVDEDSGRGIGLDIIKQRVKEYNGKLNVDSDLNKMTIFKVVLPIES